MERKPSRPTINYTSNYGSTSITETVNLQWPLPELERSGFLRRLAERIAKRRRSTFKRLARQ